MTEQPDGPQVRARVLPIASGGDALGPGETIVELVVSDETLSALALAHEDGDTVVRRDDLALVLGAGDLGITTDARSTQIDNARERLDDAINESPTA